MEDLLPKVMPVIEWLREKVFMSAANIISKQFDLILMNVYTVIILIFSIWLANKILGRSYTTIEGRWGYLVVISAVLFWVLRYLGT